MLSMGRREFDVVVFGASGVTGRNVAAHLAHRCPQTGMRWAAAGRNPRKLAHVLRTEGIEAPMIVADAGDAASLRSMAERARVVVNVAGPYGLYADPVIEACVAAGSHYLDLAGEIPFVRRIVRRLHARAADEGVKVVQVCGFEAMPADLGVLLLCEMSRAQGSELAAVDVEMRFTRWAPGPMRPSDTLSGGTMQSVIRAVGDSDAEFLNDPSALVSDAAAARAVRAAHARHRGIRRAASGVLVTPMLPFPFINPPIIYRSAELTASERGEALRPFVYREGAAITTDVIRPVRMATAAIVIVFQMVLEQTARARPSIRRRVSAGLARTLPGSGFGPSRDRLAPWAWAFSLVAETAAGRRLGVNIEGDGHPGYLATARMIAEAGLMIAEPGVTPERAGCLTPAIALGTGRIDRLRHAHVRFAKWGEGPSSERDPRRFQ